MFTNPPENAPVPQELDDFIIQELQLQRAATSSSNLAETIERPGARTGGHMHGAMLRCTAQGDRYHH